MLNPIDQPLAIAGRVLQASTLAAFRQEPYTVCGWKIIDRWALNSPAKLRSLERAGLVELLNRVLDQQRLETRALLDSLPDAEGLAEHEVLALHQIRTEL